MYTPKHFQLSDEQEAISFMQRYSFAIIVTATDNVPFATHLPFLVSKRDDKIVLSSHFAKANPQATEIIGKDVLVIFTEPHAYISPKHYEKETNVPTWNYIAVHIYGKIKIIEGEKLLSALTKIVHKYEAGSTQPVSVENMSEQYLHKQINGIVGFEIEIDEIQPAYKLSQNRDAVNHTNITNELEKKGDYHSLSVAEAMKKHKKK